MELSGVIIDRFRSVLLEFVVACFYPLGWTAVFKDSREQFRPQATQAHYMNADVTLACERCRVTNGYLQRLVWDVNDFSKKRKNVMFLNKIDVLYCLVVFFVVCPRLRPF